MFGFYTSAMFKGERFNSISHLVGTALASAGGVALVVVASQGGDTRRIVAFSIDVTILVLV